MGKGRHRRPGYGRMRAPLMTPGNPPMTQRLITRSLLAAGVAVATLVGTAKAIDTIHVKQPPPAKLDRAAIVRELRDMTPAGVDWRLGPDYGILQGKDLPP